MISYEEAGRVLDDAVDALPEEIFRELNGGVNLLRRSCTDEHGLLVMGTYNVNQMGRYIEIYYGSFKQKYRDASPEKCERELVHTLKHELTHHIESLALDRSLEKWDEQHIAELLSGLYDETMVMDSVLFADRNGCGLAEMACSMFLTASRENGIDDIPAACASISPGPLNIKAARAASRYGVTISSGGCPAEISRELCSQYDVVLCMTDSLAAELAARWPDLDERFMCLGETDFEEPKFDSQLSWNRLADNMAADINQLVDELTGEDDEYY